MQAFGNTNIATVAWVSIGAVALGAVIEFASAFAYWRVQRFSPQSFEPLSGAADVPGQIRQSVGRVLPARIEAVAVGASR